MVILDMVKIKMPIANVDYNIKPTTLRDLINSRKSESLSPQMLIDHIRLVRGPSESSKFLERGL